MATATKVKKPQAAPLGPADFCDRCPARARYRVLIKVENELLDLLFCKHHGERNAPALHDNPNVLDIRTEIASE